MVRILFVVLFALSSLHCATVKEPAPAGAPAQPAIVREMTVQEFARLREAGDAPFLLDVRNPEEIAIATMGADQHIPLGELPARIEELAVYRDKPIVVHCRTGRRSAEATKLLVEAGFTLVINLTGGIQAWSREVDPSVPTY
jgi:sulfur-carrier protein adenylyltransferase/sulfurtransferase